MSYTNDLIIQSLTKQYLLASITCIALPLGRRRLIQNRDGFFHAAPAFENVSILIVCRKLCYLNNKLGNLSDKTSSNTLYLLIYQFRHGCHFGF